MISFIHTGDLHLGLQFKSMRFDSNERRFELWHTFERIVHKAMEEKVDFLFIAGDLYEESYFTYKDIKRVKDILSKAEAVQILIAAGNHDTLNKNSLYYSVEWPDNVTIFGTEGIEKRNSPIKIQQFMDTAGLRGRVMKTHLNALKELIRGRQTYYLSMVMP